MAFSNPSWTSPRKNLPGPSIQSIINGLANLTISSESQKEDRHQINFLEKQLKAKEEEINTLKDKMEEKEKRLKYVEEKYAAERLANENMQKNHHELNKKILESQYNLQQEKVRLEKMRQDWQEESHSLSSRVKELEEENLKLREKMELLSKEPVKNKPTKKRNVAAAEGHPHYDIPLPRTEFMSKYGPYPHPEFVKYIKPYVQGKTIQYWYCDLCLQNVGGDMKKLADLKFVCKWENKKKYSFLALNHLRSCAHEELKIKEYDEAILDLRRELGHVPAERDAVEDVNNNQ